MFNQPEPKLSVKIRQEIAAQLPTIPTEWHEDRLWIYLDSKFCDDPITVYFANNKIDSIEFSDGYQEVETTSISPKELPNVIKILQMINNI